MPWSGGVYTRGYPSWTNDANNNLPISATKFDLEDNDFAAGLNNCLTIDGLNKPTATLSWAQIIALTRGSDGNLFSLARTGGATNPSITWSAVDSGNHIKAALNTGNFALDLAPTAYSFGNATDNPTFTFLGSGKGVVNGSWSFYGDPSQTTLATSAIVLGAQSASIPMTQYIASTQSANNKLWRAYVNGLSWKMDVEDDAFTTTSTALTITRSAVSISEIDFGNTTDNPVVKSATAGALREIGFRNGETNVQNTPYTLQQTDGGRVVESGATAGGTITVPQLAADTIITYINGTTGSVTLAAGTGMTLRLGNSPGTTGNRTVAQWAAATIYYTATTVAYVFGGGVT